jgi:hypothetical protein
VFVKMQVVQVRSQEVLAEVHIPRQPGGQLDSGFVELLTQLAEEYSAYMGHMPVQVRKVMQFGNCGGHETVVRVGASG